MTERLSLIVSDSTDPRHNLALEAVLLETAKENTVILYLWQNDNTVVIGRNQNIWKECNLKNIERDGVTIVRRPSGGGAVYHDLGNLNFSFIAEDRLFDIERQTRMIMKALAALGIETEMSGRNDILAQGKKISGNAYQHHRGFSCQHGTLLVNSDLSRMGMYLNADPAKLKAKGVDSVRSRVTSLKEICGKADIGILKEEIIKSCEETLKTEAETNLIIDPEALRKEEERFSSEAWTYGRNPPFDLFLENRFAWGGIRLEFRIKAGRIADLTVWTDAMDTEIASRLKEILCGCVFSSSCMYEALQKCGKEEYRDIAAWILNQEV